jgi:hypothetical protein
MNRLIIISKWELVDVGEAKMNSAEVDSFTDSYRDITSLDVDLIPPNPNINVFSIECKDAECQQSLSADSRFFVVCEELLASDFTPDGFVELLVAYLVSSGVDQDNAESIFLPLANFTYQQIIDELISRIKTPGSLQLAA